jgi:hypothetical protein
VISVPLNQSHCPPWRNRDEEVAHKIHLSHEGKEEPRPWLGNYALVITWKDTLDTVLLPLSITTFGPRRLAHWQEITSAAFQEFNPHLQYGWYPWYYEVLLAKFVSSPVLNVTDVEFSTSPWMITYLRLSTSIYFHSITGITFSRGPCYQSYRQVN